MNNFDILVSAALSLHNNDDNKDLSASYHQQSNPELMVINPNEIIRSSERIVSQLVNQNYYFNIETDKYNNSQQSNTSFQEKKVEDALINVNNAIKTALNVYNDLISAVPEGTVPNILPPSNLSDRLDEFKKVFRFEKNHDSNDEPVDEEDIETEKSLESKPHSLQLSQKRKQQKQLEPGNSRYNTRSKDGTLKHRAIYDGTMIEDDKASVKQRKREMRSNNVKTHSGQLMKGAGEKWRELPESEKRIYHLRQEEAATKYQAANKINKAEKNTSARKRSLGEVPETQITTTESKSSSSNDKSSSPFPDAAVNNNNWITLHLFEIPAATNTTSSLDLMHVLLEPPVILSKVSCFFSVLANPAIGYHAFCITSLQSPPLLPNKYANSSRINPPQPDQLAECQKDGGYHHCQANTAICHYIVMDDCKNDIQESTDEYQIVNELYNEFQNDSTFLIDDGTVEYEDEVPKLTEIFNFELVE
ncbi:16528_t:CDS:2 [Entrophospora sp. SA101]|nr:16528_t:CDS:2 [Entrophospora sp. SA101]